MDFDIKAPPPSPANIESERELHRGKLAQVKRLTIVGSIGLLVIIASFFYFSYSLTGFSLFVSVIAFLFVIGGVCLAVAGVEMSSGAGHDVLVAFRFVFIAVLIVVYIFGSGVIIAALSGIAVAMALKYQTKRKATAQKSLEELAYITDGSESLRINEICRKDSVCEGYITAICKQDRVPIVAELKALIDWSNKTDRSPTTN